MATRSAQHEDIHIRTTSGPSFNLRSPLDKIKADFWIKLYVSITRLFSEGVTCASALGGEEASGDDTFGESSRPAWEDISTSGS